MLPPLRSQLVQLLQLRVGQLLRQQRDEQVGGRPEDDVAQDASGSVIVIVGFTWVTALHIDLHT